MSQVLLPHMSSEGWRVCGVPQKEYVATSQPYVLKTDAHTHFEVLFMLGQTCFPFLFFNAKDSHATNTFSHLQHGQ